MKLATTAPVLRFSTFKEKWKEERIDWFLKRVDDPVDVDKNESYREIGIRSHGKGIFHKPAVKGAGLGDKRVFWVQPNAFIVNIVFAWEQAVALTTENERGFIASHRFPMFVARENRIDTKFMLYFFLRNKGRHLLGLASPGGAGRNKTLGQSEFSKLKIFAPSVEEQKKIASFLSLVEEKINKLRRKRELLETYRQGLMQKLFLRVLRFRQDSGFDFPDWNNKKLGEMGGFLGGGTPSRSNPSYWKGNIPWLSSSDLSENSIHNVTTTRFITLEAIKESATKIVPKGSLLIVSRVGVGKLAIALEDVCTSQDFANFTPREDNVTFLGYQLFYRRNDLLRIGQGTSIKGFTNSDLASLNILLPCGDEQKKIADSLAVFDKKLEAVNEQINLLETFKKGLLQKMFV